MDSTLLSHTDTLTPGYDFQGATFDLNNPDDRDIVAFMLSQALYGEATGVYCGKSLYAARSLEAAKFYVKQARQELNHLELFARIFRQLDLHPQKPHFVVRLLASHNNYYPLKVMMEHAIGEGMVLDVFKDVLLQTLPDTDENMASVKKMLRVVCKEEVEHVQWGEKETQALLKVKPWLKWPYYGIVELQLLIAPLIVKMFKGRTQAHPVLSHLPGFLAHVRSRVRAQGQAMGFIPATRPNALVKMGSILWGMALYVRSQFSRSRSTLDKTYLIELGFESPSP